MSKTPSRKPLALALGAAFALGAVGAQASVFQTTDLSSGYMVAALGDKSGEHKCGEGKCGEAKCGEDKAAEAKCGEGKCGEAKCGEDKAAEAKCGEGKCGGKQ